MDMFFHVITVAGAVHLLQNQKCVNMRTTTQLTLEKSQISWSKKLQEM